MHIVNRIVFTALLVGFLTVIQFCETGNIHRGLSLSHTAVASTALLQSTDAGESIEAESMTSDGKKMSRDNAQGGNTTLLKSGDTIEYQFDLPADGVYSLDVRYSNDGARDSIEVSVDDGLYTGSFVSIDTRPPGGDPGSGWNNFASNNEIGPVNLTAGDHVLKLTAVETDEYGVEIDVLHLTQQPVQAEVSAESQPGGTTSPLEQSELEGPSATIITSGLSIREGPGTDYTRTGVIGLNQRLTVIEKSDTQCSWLRVETLDGTEGWISGSPGYVRLSEDCDTIPLAVSTEESEQTVTRSIEAESADGDGVETDRSKAEGEKTIALNSAQSQDYFLDLPFDGDYTFTVRYSNDGDPDSIAVDINDERIGTFKTKNTRPATGDAGSGWNSFAESTAIGPIPLTAGDHILSLVVEDADPYGVEIDAISLSAVETAVTSPEPSAVVVAAGIRVRRGPGADFDSNGLVRRNAVLAVVGKSDEDCTWLMIVAPDGTKGWVEGGSGFVTLSPSCADVQLVELEASVDADDTGDIMLDLLIDAESVSGDAAVKPRSKAHNDYTVLLDSDEGLQFPVELPLDGRYGLEIQYSNDGGIDTVEIGIDGATIGDFQTDNTRPAGGVPGSGWDVFTSSGIIETDELSAGEHTVDVFVSLSDPFGVEFDALRIYGPLTGTVPISNIVPLPVVEVLIRGESGRGDGEIKSRGAAEDSSTVWLHDGESRTYAFTMPQSALVSVNVRYSNDNDNRGPFERVEVIVDGESVGEFSPIDTGDNGDGWNVFEWSGIIGEVNLDTGAHQLEIEITGGDGYGVEIDEIELLSID